MNAKQRMFAAIAVVLLVLAGAWLLVPRDRAVVVVVAAVGPAERVLAVNGRIRPRLQVDIRPLIGGALVALPFDVGDRVAAGQMLARIDDAPEAAAIAEAEAAVQAQTATLAQARRELARFEALGQFATRRDVEQRRLAVVEGARELNRRQAGAVQAREQRERRVLRAPFAGVILERPVDPGQTVGLDSIIYRLADLARPQVLVEVDEIYAAEIRPGMAAMVRLPGGKRLLRAEVLHVEPRVDPATGARDVRLGMIDAVGGSKGDVVGDVPGHVPGHVPGDVPGDVPSGLTVTVNLVIETRARAISVPRRAILQAGDEAMVRIVGADDVVRDRAVRFVDWPAERVIVTSGIGAGDRVLVDPAAAEPGESVRPVAGG